MVERRRVIGTQKNQPPQGLACVRFCKESHTAKKAVAEPATAAASRLAPMGAKPGESGIVLHHSFVGYLLAPRYREPTRLPHWRRSEPHRAKQAILSLSSWVSPSACSVTLTNRGANFVAHSAHTSTNLTRFSWIATRTKPPAHRTWEHRL